MGLAETDEAMAAEPFELMQCFYRRYHVPIIRFRADLDAHIDIPTLKQAVDLSAGDACLKGPILFHMLASLLSFESLEKAFFKLGGIPIVSYSNLGILDEKRLAFGTRGIESAFIATALKHPPSFQLSVSTFRGSCTMTHGLFVDDGDIPFVDSFLDGIKTELLSVLSR